MSKEIKVFNSLPLKGWEYKDDRKLFKYDDSKVKLSGLLQVQSLIGLFNDLAKKRNKFTVAGNSEYKETDSTNSVQSSLNNLSPPPIK